MKLAGALLLAVTALGVAARNPDLPKLPPAVDDPLPPPEIRESIVIKEDLIMPPPPPPAQPSAPGEEAGSQPRRPRRDPRATDTWRAYSRLSEQERREMTDLQARDPEAFRKAMQTIAEQYQQEKRAQEKRLKELLTLYQGATEQERRMIESHISKMVRTEYLENLQEHHRHLKAMKERVDKLEKELQFREKNTDSVIKAIVDDMLLKAGTSGDSAVPPAALP